MCHDQCSSGASSLPPSAAPPLTPSLHCSAERTDFSLWASQNRISREILLNCRTRRKSLKNKHEHLKTPDGILRKENMLSFQETGMFRPNNRCPGGGSLAGISLKQCTAPGAESFPTGTLSATRARTGSPRATHLAHTAGTSPHSRMSHSTSDPGSAPSCPSAAISEPSP